MGKGLPLDEDTVLLRQERYNSEQCEGSPTLLAREVSLLVDAEPSVLGRANGSRSAGGQAVRRSLTCRSSSASSCC